MESWSFFKVFLKYSCCFSILLTEKVKFLVGGSRTFFSSKKNSTLIRLQTNWIHGIRSPCDGVMAIP